MYHLLTGGLFLFYKGVSHGDSFTNHTFLAYIKYHCWAPKPRINGFFNRKRKDLIKRAIT